MAASIIPFRACQDKLISKISVVDHVGMIAVFGSNSAYYKGCRDTCRDETLRTEQSVEFGLEMIQPFLEEIGHHFELKVFHYMLMLFDDMLMLF